MVAQGCSPLKPNTLESSGIGIEQFLQLQQSITTAAQEGVAAHVVERDLFRKILELGYVLFGVFLKLTGEGDLGETVQLQDGRVVTRLSQLHCRRLLTVFGEFTIERYVYGTQEKQRIELIPVDTRLQLPQSEVSYLLQEWDQLLGIESAFSRTRDVIEQILHVKQSVDTLEGTNRQMAESSPEFRITQPKPDPKEEGTLLVVTEDNKGIPMVRPVEEKPAGAHRKKGEKANKKQMACIGCVYTVDPLNRTPEELVKILFRDEDRPKLTPSTAKQKRYWAELSREINGEKIRGQERVFKEMKAEVTLRRTPDQVLIHLSDGQKSLETDRNEYLPRDENTVNVLDLMHVLPRLWQAAHVFHVEGSKTAEEFVRDRLLRVLEGKVVTVVSGLRQMATKHKLAAAKRKTLHAACNFLAKNVHRMKYNEYLSSGYPIATGVIEGACRHVIKDRMERAGMRWKVAGAQAMLHLRTIHANGDWEKFQEFRVERETKRLYPNDKVVSEADWPFAQAA